MSRAVADQLRAAKALIDTPEKWTTRKFARDAGGTAVPVDSPRVTCRCFLGAVMVVSKLPAYEAFTHPATVAFARAAGCHPGNVPSWQDAGSHADVLAAADKAIAAEEATP